jgi:hypothetical protein
MAERFTAFAGADRRRKLTLLDAYEQPVAGLTGAVAPSVRIWAGDDRTTAWSASLAWIDAAAATLELSWTGAATASVAPGRYRIVARLLDGSRTYEYDAGEVEILAAPGAATAGPSYITAAELLDHVPWLGGLQDAGEQAGFAEARATAREWLDELVVGRYAGSRSDWLDLHGPGAASWMRERLAEDRLIVRPWVRRCQAAQAAYLVLRHQVGSRGETPYQALAKDFQHEASVLARTGRAEVDVSASKDGSSVLGIDLGVIRVGRG